MGCPDTFEFRRIELSELSKRKLDEISNEEIADSFFYEATKPNGVYRRYLEVAQLCNYFEILF